ncbi:MAG: hypothetical protein K0R23_1507, partial [Lacrimispora sp.]|nr:hypothetical protein [Lacrimispora sp.]
LPININLKIKETLGTGYSEQEEDYYDDV